RIGAFLVRHFRVHADCSVRHRPEDGRSLSDRRQPIRRGHGRSCDSQVARTAHFFDGKAESQCLSCLSAARGTFSRGFSGGLIVGYDILRREFLKAAPAAASFLALAAHQPPPEPAPEPGYPEIGSVKYMPSDYPIHAKPFSEVMIMDDFWKPKLARNA